MNRKTALKYFGSPRAWEFRISQDLIHERGKATAVEDWILAGGYEKPVEMSENEKALALAMGEYGLHHMETQGKA
jgi:hypothetical protein